MHVNNWVFTTGIRLDAITSGGNELQDKEERKEKICIELNEIGVKIF